MATWIVDPGELGAFDTIAQATAWARPGDVIVLTPGRHIGCATVNDVAIVGGGSGNTFLSDYGACPDAAVLWTVGEVSVTGVTVGTVDGAAFSAHEGTLTLRDVNVEGVNVRNGLEAEHADVVIDASSFWYVDAPGGSTIDVEHGDLHVSDSWFAGNVGRYAVVNVVGDHPVVVLDRVTFDGNAAGGIVVVTGYGHPIVSAVQVSGSVFDHNVGSQSGGALSVARITQVDVWDNRFCDDVAAVGGAVASRGNTRETWTWNRFVQNRAPDGEGGAMRVERGADVTIEHNTFVGNSVAAVGFGSALWAGSSGLTFSKNLVVSGAGGAALHLDDASTASHAALVESDLYDNAPSALGGYAELVDAENVVSEAPRFVALSLDGDCGNDDLHLIDPIPGEVGTLDAGAYPNLDPIVSADTDVPSVETDVPVDTAPTDTSAGGGGGRPDEAFDERLVAAGSCGCEATGPAPGSLAVFAAALGFVRRRRR